MRSDLRWLGYHFDYFPPDPARAGNARDRRLARQRAAAFDADPAQGDAVILPVVATPDGETFLLLDVSGRAFGIPYCRATAGDADLARAPVRGFLGRDALPEEAAEARVLRDLMTRAAAKPSAGGGAGGGAGPGTAGKGGGSGPGSESRPDDGSGGASNDPFRLSAGQQTILGEGLASMMTGEHFGVTNMAMSAGLQFVGDLARDLLGRVLPGKQLDDTSSSSDYLQAQVVDRLQAEMQSQLMGVLNSQVGRGAGSGLLDRLEQTFVGESSDATLAMIGTGHADDAGNTVQADGSTGVLVEGVPVATMAHGGDLLLPAGKVIADGSLTVLCADRHVTRSTASTAVPSTLQAGAPSVLVGGPGLAAPVVEILLDALANTGQPQAALAIAKSAQAAYEGAKRNGASDAQAASAARAAAAATRIDEHTSLLLVNSNYGEPGGDGREPDARGVVLTVDAQGNRILRLTGEGRGGDPVAVREGDRLVVPVTGETFKVESVSANESTGYRATIMVNEQTGQAVMIFNGTDEGLDWFTNVTQALGFIPPQYSQAAAEAAAFRAQYPHGEILGHSLGGGLAAYASALTGLPARVFNPAGLGDGAIRDIYDRGVTTTLANIETVIVDGEAVDLAQSFGVGPPTHGNVTKHEGPGPTGAERWNPVKYAANLHRTPYVIEATTRYPPREFGRTPIRSPRR